MTVDGAAVVPAASPTAPSGPTPSRRMHRSLFVALLGALLVAPVAIACGVSAANAPPAVETVTIAIHYSHYVRSFLAVPVGVPVRFVIRNLDPIDHEWIVGDALVHQVHRTGTETHHGARPTEVSIAALATVETVVTFPAQGSLQFVCHLPGHERYGMVGTLDIH